MTCIIKYGCQKLPLPNDKDFSSLGEMVDWYIEKRKDRLFANMQSFKTLLDCITGAPGKNKERLPSSTAPDVPRYKKGSHQRRLSNIVINKVLAKFNSLNLDPHLFADFDSFVDYITENKVKGFGPTCIYDFCINYGYKHGLKPEAKVYIHTGPAISVKVLRELGLIDAKVVDHRIDHKDLPAEIQRLDAAMAEDFLCVFHNAIAKLGTKKQTHN